MKDSTMPSLSGTYGYQPLKKKKKKISTPNLAPIGFAPAKETGPSKAKKKRVSKRLRKAVSKRTRVEHPSLGPRQEKFTQVLAKETGLNPRVLAGMAAHEQPHDRPSVQGSDNWLNIGYYDRGPGAPTRDKRFFEGPQKAAKTTANFFKGKTLGASEGIRNIQGTAKQSPTEQVKAIQRSGWATSGHPHLAALASQTTLKGQPIPRKLKTKAREVLGKEKTQQILSPHSAPEHKQASGPYAGSQKKVLQALPKKIRDEGRHDSRSPEVNAATPGASPTSDHLTTNTGAYAADIPGTLDDGVTDKYAKQIAKHLGMKGHRRTNTITKDGYRYQLIWQDEGHWNHIHLGAKWVGGGDIPPSSASGVQEGLGLDPGKRGAKFKRGKRKPRRRYAEDSYYTVAREEDEKRARSAKTRKAVKQVRIQLDAGRDTYRPLD
jgi:hypothetical protein